MCDGGKNDFCGRVQSWRMNKEGQWLDSPCFTWPTKSPSEKQFTAVSGAGAAWAGVPLFQS